MTSNSKWYKEYHIAVDWSILSGNELSLETMLDVVLVSGFVVGGLFIMCWILGDWKLEVLETIKPI